MMLLLVYDGIMTVWRDDMAIQMIDNEEVTMMQHYDDRIMLMLIGSKI